MQGELPGIDPAIEVISQRDFAKLVGVSSPAINKAIGAGRLSAECVVQTKAGQQLYREAALAEWAAVHAGFDASSAIAGDGDVDSAKLKLVNAAGKNKWGAYKTQQEALVVEEKRKLLSKENAELEGLLHRAEDIEAVWADAITNARAKLLSLPLKIAGKIGIRAKKDRLAVSAIIEREVELILMELAGSGEIEQISEQRGKRLGSKNRTR